MDLLTEYWRAEENQKKTYCGVFFKGGVCKSFVSFYKPLGTVTVFKLFAPLSGGMASVGNKRPAG